MSTHNNTSDMEENWAKLSARWRGDAAVAFHEQYVLKLEELTQDFDAACEKLEQTASDLLSELQTIAAEASRL